MKRRSYNVNITVNGYAIKRVVIDPHYELKHSETINDKVIIQLVERLDGGEFRAIERDDEHLYFVNDKMQLHGKLYKLVWLLDENEIFIGVINAYRRKS